MKWQWVIGYIFFTSAASVLLIESGEFALLIYVWGFATPDKAASGIDNVIIIITALVIALATLLLVIAALKSIHRMVAWPTLSTFRALVAFVVAIQFLSLLMGAVDFDGAWLNEFFRTKAPTFVAGIVSAVVIAITCLIAPTRGRRTNSPSASKR